MSRPLSLLFALGAGFAGALAALALFGPGASDYTSGQPSSAALSAPSDERDDEIAALRAEVAALHAALNSMELRFTERRSVASAAPEGTGAEPFESSAAGFAAVDSAESELLGDPLLDTRIEAVIERRKEIELENQIDEWRVSEDKRVAKGAADIALKLELDDYQAGELERVLVEANRERVEYIANAKRTGEWDEDHARETFLGLRERALSDLSPTLTPEQTDSLAQIMVERGRKG